MNRSFSGILLLIVAICAVAAAQGIITTYAGADWIFHGDGQPALSAVFGGLVGIAVDPGGNPVMVDNDSHVVVRLNSDGTLSLVAGKAFRLIRATEGRRHPLVFPFPFQPSSTIEEISILVPYQAFGRSRLMDLFRPSRATP
jgi:hypothetical protein